MDEAYRDLVSLFKNIMGTLATPSVNCYNLLNKSTFLGYGWVFRIKSLMIRKCSKVYFMMSIADVTRE